MYVYMYLYVCVCVCVVCGGEGISQKDEEEHHEENCFDMFD